MASADPKAVRELLAFYLEAGVDALVQETPTDRFAPDAAERAAPADSTPAVANVASNPGIPAPSGTRPSLQRASHPPPRPSIAPAPPEQAVMAAREAARSAASLEDLRAIVEAFEGCALKISATRLVFADGDPHSRVMFVGEAPGAEEDREGLPFVGRSGKLLDLMLGAIGLDRTKVYIANVIPWRPPGNRTPTPQETEICLPFTRRQIELADPDILVCMGKPAMQTLLGVTDGIRKMRGRWMTYDTGTREIKALATFHPAYLLRSSLEKRHAWKDMLAVKRALGDG